MKWTLSELQYIRNRKNHFEVSEQVNVDDINKLDSDIRAISPVEVTGHADFGSNKIVFNLNIVGEMILPCSRTLVDVKYPFNIEAREVFLLRSSGYEDFDSDEDVHVVDGESLDLLPYIKEQILLEIPMQVISEGQIDDKNRAPLSGEGWDVISEEQQKEKVDPRLEKLKDFFNKS